VVDPTLIDNRTAELIDGQSPVKSEIRPTFFWFYKNTSEYLANYEIWKTAGIHFRFNLEQLYIYTIPKLSSGYYSLLIYILFSPFNVNFRFFPQTELNQIQNRNNE